MLMFFLYLDPGTGSMLLQAIIAGALGFSMFFKTIKFRIMSLLGMNNSDKDSDEFNKK